MNRSSRDRTGPSDDRPPGRDIDQGGIRRRVYRESGIDLAADRIESLLRRLARRWKLGPARTRGVLLELTNDDPRWADVIESATVNETSFFRTIGHFEWLERWLTADPDGPTGEVPSVWSAACSFGAEPYSVAMLAHAVDRDVSVLGTDLDRSNILRARKGRYPIGELDDIPERFHSSVVVSGDYFEPTPAVAAPVRFDVHNLLQPPPGQFDLVMLRNVLIYFDDDSVRKVMANMEEATRTGGHLIVGPSEGVTPSTGAWDRVTPSIYRRRS